MQTGMVDNTSSTSSSTSSTSAAKNTLDKNAFLSLLVAQLKNQDPTNAQDPNQMVSQMAQFSALEQQQNSNSLLTSLQSQLSAMYQTQAAGMVGKKVQVTSSSLNLQDGSASIGVNLPSAANVSISILNSSGKQVATLTPGTMASGSQVVNWNGKDSNGNQLADGTYTVAIDAKGADGSAVAATTTSYATVTAVSFTNGAVTVTAGGQQYPLSAVNAVSN